ncbi:MAG: DinB family protein [bacterium]|nr:DinB family protein [bacterium]
MELNPGQPVEILAQTPGTLRSLLGGLSDSWLLKNEGPGTWSPYDVMGHLIHGEETDWIPRLKIILEHGENKPFTPFDRVAFFQKSKGKTLHDLLTTFETLRKENLRTLDGLQLKPHQLVLKGTHPELGTVTLWQLIATWAVHDLGHIQQIVRTMAHQYKDATGPWRAYLSILG